MRLKFYLYTIAISCIILSCEDDKKNEKLQKNPKQKIQLTAKDILGNPNYLAISYGGYRKSMPFIVLPTLLLINSRNR